MIFSVTISLGAGVLPLPHSEKRTSQAQSTNCGTVGLMEPRSVWKLDRRIWLGLGVLALSLVMFVYTSRADGAIAAREGTAEGIVTAQETARFGYRYNYVFSANGQRFTGWDSSSKNDLGIGMQVFVYYDS